MNRVSPVVFLILALVVPIAIAQPPPVELSVAKPIGEPLGEPLPGSAAFPRPSPVFSARYSADGKTVLTARIPPKDVKGAASEARLWDATTGKPVGPLLSFNPKDIRVTVGLGEKTVVTVHPDRMKSVIQSWDATTGKSVWGPATHDATFISHVMISPDGKTIVTHAGGDRPGSTDTARLWDAATGKAISERLLINRHHSAFSPDGKTLVTGTGFPKTGAVQLWNVATGKPRGEPLTLAGWSVANVGFSLDGETFHAMTVGGNREWNFRVWDTATLKPLGEGLRFPSTKGKVFKFGVVIYTRPCMFCPDGRTVLFMTDEKTAQLWDAVTGKTHGAALQHKDLAYRADFSPDGKVLLTASGSSDKDSEIRLWDVASGKPFCRVPHKGQVRFAVFSPDGSAVLIAGEKDARLWQVPKLGK